MPYKTISELPSEPLNILGLPPLSRMLYLKAFNLIEGETRDAKFATNIAVRAVLHPSRKEIEDAISNIS